MQASTVVIGANFGDEGKGLITDFETRRLGAKIVGRFNGGAQAGHTVSDGELRHVFGHFGAGTFAGADTYLSSRFIVNPFLFAKEYATLEGLGHKPLVRCHDEATVTTIYDMALNGLAEIARGSSAHGSCGVGINETVTRTLANQAFKIPAKHAHSTSYVKLVLDTIKADWLPERMKQLGITDALRDNPEAANLFKILDMETEFHALSMVNANMRLYPRQTAPNGVAVFEGAQGLQLDEFMGTFPHVTRSMTGLPFAIEAAAELGIKELQPVYVTRSYLTRHGNGPLGDEGKLPFTVTDSTNVLNRWQGQLRFAPLDVCSLEYFIKQDLERAKVVAQMHGVTLREATLAITWADVAAEVPLVVECYNSLNPTTIMDVSMEELPNFLEEEIGIRTSHIAYGPEHKDVRFLGWE